MTKEQVKEALNTIGYYREFTVVFTKKDGTERKITGFMEQPDGQPKSSTSVPITVTKGESSGQWRSFRLDSVLNISV